MFSFSRLIAGAVMLIASMVPELSAAAGIPAPPLIFAPSVGVPPWAINVPMQLANIPTRYPRFRVDCDVWSPPVKNPWPFQNPNPVMIGSGKQDWSLNPNGSYAGTMIVRVYLLQGYAAWQGQGGSYNCWLKLLDANNNAYDPGPSADPSLRPQDGTTFVGHVYGVISGP
jgi:hypothetical protein